MKNPFARQLPWIGAVLAALFFWLLGLTCARADVPRTFEARVTFYDPQSCGWRDMTSTGVRAREGGTVAVDPKLIPYGSQVRIPALAGIVGKGRFVAQDTGTAVKSRKAARAWGSRAPVIDVYVASRARLHQVERRAPMFCMVEVSP